MHKQAHKGYCISTILPVSSAKNTYKIDHVLRLTEVQKFNVSNACNAIAFRLP